VDVLGPHVQEGHYDLLSADGMIILPSVWEDSVEPEMHINMTMWPMDGMSNRPTLPPVEPARWESKSNPQGRPFDVNSDTGIIPRRPPNAGPRSSRTPAILPPPGWPTPRSTAPSHNSTPERDLETREDSKEWRHRRHQPRNARNHHGPSERLELDEEFSKRITELNAITKPAVIEIVKDMQECSQITQTQAEKGIKYLKTISSDSFEGVIRAFQADISSKRTERQESPSRYSSPKIMQGLAALKDVVGGDTEYRHNREQDSDHSTEGQDHESIAPTSDSEDWEDYTDDEETIVEDEDDSIRRSNSPSIKGYAPSRSRRVRLGGITHGYL
jgi:hypothetical protein